MNIKPFIIENIEKLGWFIHGYNYESVSGNGVYLNKYGEVGRFCGEENFFDTKEEAREFLQEWSKKHLTKP